jgi:hypothetical protein
MKYEVALRRIAFSAKDGTHMNFDRLDLAPKKNKRVRAKGKAPEHTIDPPAVL